jgi:hypothetical protein
MHSPVVVTSVDWGPDTNVFKMASRCVQLLVLYWVLVFFNQLTGCPVKSC